jgi:hypothetical protein
MSRRDRIVFRQLNLADPGQVPIGLNAVSQDDIGFTRSAWFVGAAI